MQSGKLLSTVRQATLCKFAQPKQKTECIGDLHQLTYIVETGREQLTEKIASEFSV